MSDPRSKLHAVPMTIKRANRYVKQWHRTHPPVQGGMFAIAVARAGETEPCGVAIVGRPCRTLDDGWCAEVTRSATDGTPNANSFLYGLARRIAFTMGYRDFTTLSLRDESGASMRAVGFPSPKKTKGGTWNRASRPRTDKHPTGKKFRWTQTNPAIPRKESA